VRELLQGDEANALVRDALLQLAPGHIQVLAAITERWFAPSRKLKSQADGPKGDKLPAGGPPVGAIGGMVDSCYMWRSGSPLIAERERVMRLRLEREAESSD
jgi:hypothetical protein